MLNLYIDIRMSEKVENFCLYNTRQNTGNVNSREKKNMIEFGKSNFTCAVLNFARFVIKYSKELKIKIAISVHVHVSPSRLS
jgi:hypothetical protein